MRSLWSGYIGRQQGYFGLFAGCGRLGTEVADAAGAFCETGTVYSQPYLTGAVNVEYTYVYSNGIFKRVSDTVAATSLYYKDKSKLTSEYYQDGYQNYFYDNKFVAMKNLVFYSSPSGKTNFTLKKGAVATLEGFCSKDNNNYMIFKYNGQRGYIKFSKSQCIK